MRVLYNTENKIESFLANEQTLAYWYGRSARDNNRNN